MAEKDCRESSENQYPNKGHPALFLNPTGQQKAKRERNSWNQRSFCLCGSSLERSQKPGHGTQCGVTGQPQGGAGIPSRNGDVSPSTRWKGSRKLGSTAATQEQTFNWGISKEPSVQWGCLRGKAGMG